MHDPPPPKKKAAYTVQVSKRLPDLPLRGYVGDLEQL